MAPPHVAPAAVAEEEFFEATTPPDAREEASEEASSKMEELRRVRCEELGYHYRLAKNFLLDEDHYKVQKKKKKADIVRYKKRIAKKCLLPHLRRSSPACRLSFQACW